MSFRTGTATLAHRLTGAWASVPRGVRISVAVIGGALLGASIGFGALLWHSYAWGLLLGIAATFAPISLLPVAARWGFVVGWVLPVLRGAIPTKAGDLLLGATWQGYGLLIAGFTMIVVVILTLPTRGRR